MKKLSGFFVILGMFLFTSASYGQQIWSEDFSDLADGSIEDTGATAWAVDVGLGSLIAKDGQILFTGGKGSSSATWISEEIDISSYEDINVSFNVGDTGVVNKEVVDYVQGYYVLNNGSRVPIGDGVTDDVPTVISQSATVLNGATLRIEIDFLVSWNSEKYTIDDILVTGTTVIDTTQTFETCPNTSPQIGLALNSIAYGPNTDDWVVPCAIMDGSVTGDRWSAPYVSGSPVEFTIALNSIQQFNQMKIAFRRGHLRYADFEILVSSNGSNWTSTNITRLPDLAAMANSMQLTEDLQEFDIGQQSAQYIKYIGYGCIFEGGDPGSPNEIFEIQVLNTEQTDGGGSNQNECDDFKIEYSLNGTEYTAGSTILVDEGDEMVLSGPNDLNISITHPDGSQTGNGVWLGAIDATKTGTYTITSTSGCSATVEIALNTVDCDNFDITYQLNGTGLTAGSTISVDEGDEMVLSGPSDLNISITHPDGSQTGNGVWLGSIDATKTGTYTITSASGCSATVTIVLNGSTPTTPTTPDELVLLVEESFENVSAIRAGDHSKWKPEKNDAIGVAPGRNGSGNAIKFSHENITTVSGEDVVNPERSEWSINWADNDYDSYGFNWGTSYTLEYSIKLSGPHVGYGIVTQFHAVPPPDSNGIPDWSIGTSSNSFTVTADTDDKLIFWTSTDTSKMGGVNGGALSDQVAHVVDIAYNEWIDIKVSFKLDEEDGYISTWVNGNQIFTIQNQSTVYPLGTDGSRKTPIDYLKIGAYGGAGFTGEVYYDDLKIYEGEGDGSDPTDSTTPSGESLWSSATNSQNIYYTDGNVGIGTNDPGADWQLAVNGNIRAKEIKVESDWADYVFADDYKLPTLEEVEQHIKNKGHLINIPSAAEIEVSGVKLGEMNKLLLEKIEELTLYIIQQEKRIEILEASK